MSIEIYKEVKDSDDKYTDILLNYNTLNDSVDDIISYTFQKDNSTGNTWDQVQNSPTNNEYIITQDDINSRLRCIVEYTRTSGEIPKDNEKITPITDKVYGDLISNVFKVEDTQYVALLTGIGYPGMLNNEIQAMLKDNINNNVIYNDLTYQWKQIDSYDDDDDEWTIINGETGNKLLSSNNIKDKYIKVKITYDGNTYESNILQVKDSYNVITYIKGIRAVGGTITSYVYNLSKDINFNYVWEQSDSYNDDVNDAWTVINGVPINANQLLLSDNLKDKYIRSKIYIYDNTLYKVIPNNKYNIIKTNWTNSNAVDSNSFIKYSVVNGVNVPTETLFGIDTNYAGDITLSEERLYIKNAGYDSNKIIDGTWTDGSVIKVWATKDNLDNNHLSNSGDGGGFELKFENLVPTKTYIIYVYAKRLETQGGTFWFRISNTDDNKFKHMNDTTLSGSHANFFFQHSYAPLPLNEWCLCIGVIFPHDFEYENLPNDVEKRSTYYPNIAGIWKADGEYVTRGNQTDSHVDFKSSWRFKDVNSNKISIFPMYTGNDYNADTMMRFYNPGLICVDDLIDDGTIALGDANNEGEWVYRLNYNSFVNNLIYLQSDNDDTILISYNNNFLTLESNNTLKVGDKLTVSLNNILPYRLNVNISDDSNVIDSYNPIRLTSKTYKKNNNIIEDNSIRLLNNFIKFDHGNDDEIYIYLKSYGNVSYDDKTIIFNIDSNNPSFIDYPEISMNINYPKILLNNQYYIYNKSNSKFYGIDNTVETIHFKLIDNFDNYIHGINEADGKIEITFTDNDNDDNNNNNFKLDIYEYSIDNTYTLNNVNDYIINNKLDIDNKTIVLNITINTNNNLYKGSNILNNDILYIKQIDIPTTINTFTCDAHNNNRSVYVRWKMPNIDINNFNSDIDQDGDIIITIIRKHYGDIKTYNISFKNDSSLIYINEPDNIGDDNYNFYYLDSDNIIPFDIYNYKMYISYEWIKDNKKYEFRTDTTAYTNIYVCFNNKFPYGRWTTNSNNPKLYGKYVCTNNNNIKRDDDGNIIESFKSGNVYGNVSNYLTKKEIFGFLSKFKGNIMR